MLDIKMGQKSHLKRIYPIYIWRGNITSDIRIIVNKVIYTTVLENLTTLYISSPREEKLVTEDIPNRLSIQESYQICFYKIKGIKTRIIIFLTQLLGVS